ncbi:MAG: Hsp20/alpha crystallin family protein [Verrucomicrobia bacterium]|nr:Hsp20/alpha crystallin family protein [Verrucomicrobiota bacterium]
MSLLQNILPSFNRAPAAIENSASADLGATVKPTYEVKETAESYALTVSVPGVTKDGLEVTADDTQVRVVGRRAWQQPEGWTSLYRESADATYELVLTHDNAIDADKVAAELRDGVLRVTLPKHEAVKPRKIAVS